MKLNIIFIFRHYSVSVSVSVCESESKMHLCKFWYVGSNAIYS